MLRGDLSLIAVNAAGGPKVTILSQQPVKRSACFNVPKAALFIGERVFEAAVADALKHHEGATVLVNAEFIDNGRCVEIPGLPAKL